MEKRIGATMTKEPVTLGTSVMIGEAQEVMQMWGMRHLPVTDQNGQLLGLVSDRDIAKGLLNGKTRNQSVAEIMTTDPYRVLSHVSVAQVAQTMADNKYGCAVIVDPADRVRGIFTTVDALNILAQLLEDPDEVDFKVLKMDDYLIFQRQVI